MVVHHSKMGCRLPALGQNPKLPHCSSNGRFTSISGHYEAELSPSKVGSAGILARWVAVSQNSPLSGEAQFPYIFQNPSKTGLRGEAHGSIRIQEGEPRET